MLTMRHCGTNWVTLLMFWVLSPTCETLPLGQSINLNMCWEPQNWAETTSKFSKVQLIFYIYFLLLSFFWSKSSIDFNQKLIKTLGVFFLFIINTISVSWIHICDLILLSLKIFIFNLVISKFYEKKQHQLIQV